MTAAIAHRSRPTRVLAAIVACLRLPAAAINRRRVLGQLGGLDARMLRDIGLTQSDVVSAAAESVFRDPTVMLARRAQERRHAARAVARESMALDHLIRSWTETDRAA